jgi:hypothetical protein
MGIYKPYGRKYMKKLMLALALVIGFSLSHAVEVKFSSLSWIDYVGEFDSSFAYQDGDAIDLGRAYNTFKVKLGDKVKARVTMDFSKATPWKYAYADLKFADPFVVTLGLQKTWFGYTALWKYPIPVKALADSEKASSSADFGLGIGGSFADGLVMYNLQILNGEGYSKVAADLNPADYAFGAHVVITPAEIISIGLSYRMAEAGSGDLSASYLNDAIAAYVDFKLNSIWALAEYVGFLGTSLDSRVAITAGYMVSKMAGIYAHANLDITGSTQDITLGANLSPVKGLALKPYAAVALDGGLDEIALGLQTEIKFGFTVGE